MNSPSSQPAADGARLSVLVAFMTMLAPFSIDTYLPSMPDIGAEFQASHGGLQQTMSLYLIAFAVTTLVYGPLADAFGRRRVILWSCGLYVVASIGCALASGLGMLIAFRIAQGATASAGMVVGRAVIRDLFTGAHAQKAMARVMVLFSIAPALAPIVGGFLHDAAGWRSVFWFLTGMGVLLWVLVWRELRETLPEEHRHSIHPLAVGRVYRNALATPGFLIVVWVIAFNFSGMFLYVASSPSLIYDHLGLGAHDFPVLFVPLVAGIVLGSLVAGRLAGRWATRRTIAAGFTCMLIAAGLNLAQAILLPVSPVTVVAPIALYAFGTSLALSNLSIIALDYFPHNRGSASSVQGFVHTGFNGIVAGAVVPMVASGILSMAIAMALLCGTSLLLWILWSRLPSAMHPSMP